MQERFQHSVDGQEVSRDDLNLLAAGALAEDRVIQELFRLTHFQTLGTPPIARGIIPGGHARKGLTANSGLVMPVGPFIRVYPFRAVIGTREGIDAGQEKLLHDVRSAIHAGEEGTLYTVVQLSDSPGGRFDLVYCTVALDVDGPTVERLVKSGQNNIHLVELAHSKINTVTIGIVQGVEAEGSDEPPERPELPADDVNAYRMPLAYVRLPAGYETGQPIGAMGWIQEVAPVLSLAPQVGGFALRPATMHQTFPTGLDIDIDGTEAAHPVQYLPSSWVGGEQIFLAIDTNELAPGVATIVDDSIDWRRRVGKVTVQSTGGAAVAWRLSSGATEVGAHYLPTGRDSGEESYTRMFNTFVLGSGNTEVLFLDPDRGLQPVGAATNEMSFTVDSSGRLVVTPHADIGSQRVILWFEMSSQLASWPVMTPSA